MILAQIIAGHITVIIFQKALKTADVEFINKSCDSAHFIKCEALNSLAIYPNGMNIWYSNTYAT